MSRIHSFFLSGLSILMLLGGNFRLGAGNTGGPDASGAGKEIEKLQGDWILVSIKVGGKKASRPGLTGFTEETIKGDEIIRFEEKEGKKVPLRIVMRITMIDPAKSPKLMDITYYEEEDRTKPHSVAKGIYELKGDQFVFAWGGPDDRPKTFDAKKGDGVWVLVYQRKKKKG